MRLALGCSVAFTCAACGGTTPVGPAATEGLTYATFATTVASAASGASRDCLIDGSGDALRFVGEAAPAVVPSPPPAADSVGQLADAATVRLVSRWGLDGTAGPYVATLTAHPPATRVSVVLVHHGLALVRSTTPDGPRADGVHSDELGALVGTTPPIELAVLAAPPDEPADALVTFARALDARSVPVALGVVIAPDEPLVPPVTPADDDSARCATLPVAPRGADTGGYDDERARGARVSIGVMVRTCVGRMTSARVARGGRYRLAVRLDGFGHPVTACFVEDEVGDPPLRECILDALSHAALPTPEPTGLIDLVLPFTVAPDRSAVARGYCGPSSDLREGR